MQSINQGLGLNLDSQASQQKPGMLTFALNAQIVNFDGSEVAYGNEQSTTFCFDTPQGYKVIGRFNITQINKLVLFLVGENSSEIGVVNNNSCIYETLINDPCLGFDIDFPIHQLVVKSTNCSTQIYWADPHMRFLDFDNLPWKEIPDPNNDFKKIKLVGQLDCNKMLVQSNFSIPHIETEEVVEGGNITTGSYQFVVQYANELGQSYTSFYNVTNPLSINQQDRTGQEFNLPTSKAIRLKVEGLDTSGVFDYFNLVAIETINGVTTNRLYGTYPIASESYDILFTGSTGQEINIPPQELFQKFQYYDRAEGVAQSDDRLIWYNLKENQRINYQPIVSKFKFLWETYKIPYNKAEGYYNPINTEKYRGWMRDEVYPIEIAFLLKNGKQTDAFATIGRQATPQDREFIPFNNLDAQSTKDTECDESEQKQKWQVYNTGSLIGFSEAYTGHEDDPCYKGAYQYGTLAFWESEERYPNNPTIWGDLSGQKIRHHKLPDELISPRFSVDEQGNAFIYPIGINIDRNSVYSAIQESDLTQEQKDDIVGFKVIRGDRSAGNKSIKAKGHFTNVGKYTYEEQDYYFSNYPYNSLGEDPLFAKSEVKAGTGFDFARVSKPFEDNNGKDQFTFHSPDTAGQLFPQADNIDTGYMKLEAIDYGTGKGHFVPIKNNAEYKFTTPNAIKASIALSSGVALDYTRGGKASFNGADFAQVYTNVVELFEKLIAYQNFGYNINSIANFHKSLPIPNGGDKIRGIDYGSYLVNGNNTIEDGKILNNQSRESSLYLKTFNTFLYAHEYSGIIPQDNSRFIATYNNEIDITEAEFFNLLHTSMTVSTLTALILGIRAAAKDIIPDSENAVIPLAKMLARIIDPYVASGNYQGLLDLEDEEEKCDDVAGTYSDYPLTFPPGDNDEYQNRTEVYSPTGELLNYESLNWDPPTLIDVPHDTITVINPSQTFTLVYFDDVVNLTDDQLNDLIQQGYTSDEPDIQGTHGAFQFGKNLEPICGGTLLSAARRALAYATEAYKKTGQPVQREALSKPREFDVNAYYGSLKADLPSQWGRIYSYNTVDTGYYQPLLNDKGEQFLKFPTVFGGDTYINEWSFKTKQAVFTKSTVGLNDRADISLNEEGTLGHPMFYLSTKPLNYDFRLDLDALNTAFEGVGLVNKNALYGSLGQSIGSAIIAAGGVITVAVGATGVGAVVGLVVTAVGAVVYVIASIFKNVRTKIEKAVLKLYVDLFQQVADSLGVKNINLDMATRVGIAEQGIFYQYVYGIPSYFVESTVNTDMRQATNDDEGNFFPRVGTSIPDDWLQEDRTPIIYDNTYFYNKSFSKQNKENFYSHLREDFDPNKLCYSEFPNTAIYSEKTDLNETLNNWLIYKPVSRYDFPKSFGILTSLDGVQNRQVIARFVNKTQIYNALTTINTNTPETVYLGDASLFSGTRPLDLSETDTGSLGSQHKLLLKTPQGIIFTDSKRGQVILLQGTNVSILSDIGLNKWFGNNLPFFITQYFPDINTDNNYKDIGLTAVYDEYYNRFILTKRDYLPLNTDITWNGRNFLLNNQIVETSNEELFCNKSWTISFSFHTNSWTSWHSYIPNYYINYSDSFKSGLNQGVWTHGESIDSYTNYYGIQYGYKLQYPFIYQKTLDDQIIQSIQDYTEARLYTSRDNYSIPDENIYFTYAEIFNQQQHTGRLNLIPKPKNSMKGYLSYPKYNSDSKDILVTKLNSLYSFNDIRDATKQIGSQMFLESCEPTQTNLELNLNNFDFSKNMKAPLLRAKNSQVRLTFERGDYKLVSNFILQQTQDSKI